MKSNVRKSHKPQIAIQYSGCSLEPEIWNLILATYPDVDYFSKPTRPVSAHFTLFHIYFF